MIRWQDDFYACMAERWPELERGTPAVETRRRHLPPVSRFGGGNRTEKKQGVIQRLSRFFEKYLGVA